MTGETLYRKLVSEARSSATNTEHHIGRFLRYGRGTNTAQGIASCRTPGCSAYVQVDTNPAPNGIDIGGSIYGSPCSATTFVYGEGK